MPRNIRLFVVLCSLLVVVLLVSGVAWQKSQNAKSGDQPYKQLGVLDEVVQHIDDDYVTTPDMNKVTSGALHGMVEAVDPDSSYMDAEEYRLYKAAQAAPPQGQIGVVVSKRGGYVDVVDVEAGSPAAAAGLEQYDFVEAIGSDSTRDLSLERAKELLGGPAGSTVELSVVHQNEREPVRVTVRRAALPMAPLATSLNGHIGVIRVPDLDTGRTTQLAAALRALSRQGATAFVLDLRNCGAGTYTEAEHIANLFIDHGTITWLEGQTYPRVTTAADPAQAVTPHTPLIVLVNLGTAGPAEVAAAALQSGGRARLVGDHTFGDASVQKLVEIGDGSAVLLSVARYYTPAGKAVAEGLTPDVQQVEWAGNMPDDDTPPLGAPANAPDLQMQKALSLLQAT